MNDFLNLLLMLFIPFFIGSYVLSKFAKKPAAIYGGAIIITIVFCFCMDQVSSEIGAKLLRGMAWIVGGFFYLACWKYMIDRAGNKIENSEFTVWPILGIIIPGIGALVGWKYLTVGPAQNTIKNEAANSGKGKFDDFTDEQLIDFIDDNSTASAVASNSGWLKHNWHPLSYEQKLSWVGERKNILKTKFRSIVSGMTFVKAMQDTDKEFIRMKAS